MNQPQVKFNFSFVSSDNFSGWKEIKSKTSIVTRLFNQGYIDFEEATILLKEFVVIEKDLKENYWYNYPYYPYYPFNYWERCYCNPMNGGNGICNCNLGNITSKID